MKDDFAGVEFIDDVETMNVTHKGRTYEAQYVVDNENVRMIGKVEKHTFRGHLPLGNETSHAVAERLLANIIWDNHSRFFDEDVE